MGNIPKTPLCLFPTDTSQFSLGFSNFCSLVSIDAICSVPSEVENFICEIIVKNTWCICNDKQYQSLFIRCKLMSRSIPSLHVQNLYLPEKASTLDIIVSVSFNWL